MIERPPTESSWTEAEPTEPESEAVREAVLEATWKPVLELTGRRRWSP